MKTSPTMAEFTKAFVAVQNELQNPVLDATNPHFRSKYSTLREIRDCVRPVASKHGIAIIQTPERVDGEFGVTLRLEHVSGEFRESHCPVSWSDNPQKLASSITYMCRYQLKDAFCIQGEEPADDDGNLAAESLPQQPRQQPVQQTKPQSQPKNSTNGTRQQSQNGTNGQRKPWFTRTQMIEVFARLASQYEAAGLRPEYDEILAKHGVKTADEFGNGDVARAAYFDLVTDMHNREGVKQ
jgi:hypothetical protein